MTVPRPGRSPPMKNVVLTPQSPLAVKLVHAEYHGIYDAPLLIVRAYMKVFSAMFVLLTLALWTGMSIVVSLRSALPYLSCAFPPMRFRRYMKTK